MNLTNYNFFFKKNTNLFGFSSRIGSKLAIVPFIPVFPILPPPFLSFSLLGIPPPFHPPLSSIFHLPFPPPSPKFLPHSSFPLPFFFFPSPSFPFPPPSSPTYLFSSPNPPLPPPTPFPIPPSFIFKPKTHNPQPTIKIKK